MTDARKTHTTDIVSLGQIFSAPLLAVVQADFEAALRAAQYIEEFGFEKKHEDSTRHGPGASELAESERGDQHFGKLRTTSFQFRRPGPDGRDELVVVKIPTLSLVPLPLLQVADAEFDFDVRILDATDLEPLRRARRQDLGLLEEEDEPDPDELPDPNRYRWKALLAGASRDRRSENADLAPQIKANMKARVRMRQSDLPAGIANLLNIAGSNTESATIPLGTITATPPSVRFVLGHHTTHKEFSLVQVLSDNGMPAAEHSVRLELDRELAEAFRLKANGAAVGFKNGRAECLTNDQGVLALEISLRRHGKPARRDTADLAFVTELGGREARTVLRIHLEHRREEPRREEPQT